MVWEKEDNIGPDWGRWMQLTYRSVTQSITNSRVNEANIDTEIFLIGGDGSREGWPCEWSITLKQTPATELWNQKTLGNVSVYQWKVFGTAM